jgi:hypothetical protein
VGRALDLVIFLCCEVISQYLCVVEHKRLRQVFLGEDADFFRIVHGNWAAGGTGDEDGRNGVVARVAGRVGTVKDNNLTIIRPSIS